MTEFCIACGQPLKVGARFCGKCGQSVSAEATAETPPNQGVGSAAAQTPAAVPAFGWSWGAFLLPGIWLLAHRLRPNLAGIILLGLAYGGALLSLGINLLRWKGDSIRFANLQALEFAMVSAAWLLALYVAACLFSLKAAREGASAAFANDGGVDALGFQKRQQGWTAAGLIVAAAHVALVIWLASVYLPAHKKANEMPNLGADPMAVPTPQQGRQGGSR